MLGGLGARPGQTPVPVVDVDGLLLLPPAAGLLELRLVRPVAAGAAQTAAAGATGPGTATHGQADGEQDEPDHAGHDEREGGGEEGVQGARVALGRVQAPVTAVHRAADKARARGPAVLRSKYWETFKTSDDVNTSSTRPVM